MDSAAWDERYRAVDLVWGSEPNRFVAEALGAREPAGRALDLACGEGRNAIWLAQRGWRVTGVDYSPVAIARAHELAGAAGVRVEWLCADAAEHESGAGDFALVLVSYLQVPARERRAVLARAAAALAPGGMLFMIGHALRNLRDGVGGPRQPEVLWDPAELAAELRAAGFEVERCEEVLRPVEGEGAAAGAVEGEGEPREAIDVRVEARRAGAGSRHGNKSTSRSERA